MRNVSNTLFKLITKYYLGLQQAGTDCRIVVPGLTKRIADNLHQLLIDGGYPSFLVIPSNGELKPSEEDRRVVAAGLTSLRQGSMIIVTYPGEIPNLQDSLIGAGGAIRSFAFSDEWPWVPTANNAFRFEGPFLDALIAEWTEDKLVGELLKQLIIEGLLKQTGPCVSRAELFLNSILDDFDFSRTASNSVLLDFIYFCGLPCPALSGSPLKDIKRYVDNATLLAIDIDSRHEQSNVRPELLERIDEIFSKEEVKLVEIKSFIQEFFDGVNTQDVGLPSGMLSLRHCWAGSIERWRCLDIATLSSIYNVQLAKPKTILEVKIISQRGIVSLDGAKAVLNSLDELSLNIGIKGLEPLEIGKSKIKILLRAKPIFENFINEVDSEFSVPIDRWVLPEIIFNLPLRVVIENDDGKIFIEKKVNLFLVDDSRPFLAVTQNPFKVFEPSSQSDPDEFDKIVIDEPIDLFLVKGDSPEDISVEINQEEAPTSPASNLIGVLQLGNPIDPDVVPSGLVDVCITHLEKEINFYVEAKDITRGEYTLESEYIAQIASGGRTSVEKLIDIFDGEVIQPYPLLGGINDQSRKLAFFAELMESGDYKGQPILVNLYADISEPVLEFGCWNLTGAPQKEFEFISSSPPVVEILASYASARSAVLAELWSGFLKDSSRPMYAAYPIFIANRANQIERLIADYLDQYIRVLDFIDLNESSLDWEDLFLLCSVDCIHFVLPQGGISGVFLMGPWHPLVLAKRYMTQSVIHDCGRRSISSRLDWKFAKLVPLIEQHSSFRWIPALLGDDKILEYAFVSPTSDPGWLAGLSEVAIKSVEKECAVVRNVLGLELSTFPLAREQMALGYLKSFTSSFSGNRAITVHAPKSYSARKLFQSAEELLYEDDKPSIQGLQLPGGVHLLLHDIAEIDPIQWRQPPIFIYEPDRLDAHLWEESKDIDLLPPIGELKLGNLSESIPVPRGDGVRAVFNMPTRQVTSGRGGKPSSFEIEFGVTTTDSSDVSASFLRTLNRVESMGIENRKAIWTFQLPDSLQYTWNILPGGHADPAVFVHYIEEGMRRQQEARALWDYRVSVAKKINSYYTLAQVPVDIKFALNGSPIFKDGDMASTLINELGLVGIAVGGEAMRSGSHALGVIGVSAAVRMMTSIAEGIPPPLKIDKNRVGFLLSADSFYELLGGALEKGSEADTRRGDLVAIQTTFHEESNELTLSFVGIECKYSSSIYPTAEVDSALEQAERSFSRIDELARSAINPDGMPERLALAKLIEFGLRVSSVTSAQYLTLLRQSQIISCILSGRLIIENPKETSILFSTEAGFESSALIKRRGIWVRLGPNAWPGVSEAPQLLEVRRELSGIFDVGGTPLIPVQPVVVTPEPVKSPHVENSKPVDPQGEAALNGSDNPAGADIATNGVDAGNTESTVPLAPVLLGVNVQGLPIYYDPQKKGSLVENYNIMITGSSGKGKTQLVKTLVSEVRRQRKKVVMLDFKNDYSPDAGFLREAGLNVKHIYFKGLPYNPLIPSPIEDPTSPDRSQVINISQHIAGITSILGKCFQLGAQQQASLKDVIRECFKDNGIPTSGMVRNSDSFIYPDFNDVGVKLKAQNPLAYNRLDPLFDLGIFQAESSQLRFQSSLEDSSVLNVSDIPSEPIKDALAQIFILSSHAYFNALPHTSTLNILFVFDEAHRVLESENLARFVRECRAYGVGVVLSSQYPSDFQKDISASLATKVIHGNGPDRDKVRSIINLLSIQDSEERVKELGLFEAYVSNTQLGTVFINTLSYPYYLVLQKIKSGSNVKRENLENIDGLDTNRISVEEILKKLRLLSLIEEINGVYKALI
ncbi:ATP-binding protein [Polynucleobacter paneuropaeus]|nr:ATP-binding protein [Polynucleobacter paneuropaeus]